MAFGVVQFEVGDRVSVNLEPGKIEEVLPDGKSLVRFDYGRASVKPNAAISHVATAAKRDGRG